MNLNESCAKCIYDKQLAKYDDPEYLAEIKTILDNRPEKISSPEIVYKFDKIREKYFGEAEDYTDIKRSYNDLVLSMEKDLRKRISESNDPLATALVMSRIGNYIDFGAMNTVDTDIFLGLFSDTEMRDDEKKVYEGFCKECSKAKNFLLLTDNCGEVVLDKLMLEELHKKYPKLEIKVILRGGDVLNDATLEDAEYVGLGENAKLISSGVKVPGTVYSMLSEEAKNAVDDADIILSKGQGNYEAFAGEGRHAFYLFLCKCDLFINRFNVPKLTGMFVME
ncbi:MAG: ARMT1-like domain-containing protein [Lachnospiraceae bacterium]|nr:ARMT1-like domain-containing protein [Lachnospiraceae bacterium]